MDCGFYISNTSEVIYIYVALESFNYCIIRWFKLSQFQCILGHFFPPLIAAVPLSFNWRNLVKKGPAVSLSIHPSIYLSSYLSSKLFINLFIYSPFYLSTCLSVHLFFFLFIYMSVYPSIYPSTCIYLSIYLSSKLFIYQFTVYLCPTA